jgi:hypothetical protein
LNIDKLNEAISKVKHLEPDIEKIVVVNKIDGPLFRVKQSNGRWWIFIDLPRWTQIQSQIGPSNNVAALGSIYGIPVQYALTPNQIDEVKP